jgi:Holliday junction DNA helicase RuvA
VIRRIRGRLTAKGADGVEVLTSGGIGYEIAVPATLIDRLPAAGEEVELHTSLVVRDDAMELYGFGSSTDRELFRRLQSASGVGPRLALALLGALPGGRIVAAIRAKDHAALQTVSGVGRKTAERITLELIDKLDDLADGDVPARDGPTASAVQALRALGYGQIESEQAVRRAQEGTDGREVGTEELVRRALQHV